MTKQQLDATEMDSKELCQKLRELFAGSHYEQSARARVYIRELRGRLLRLEADKFGEPEQNEVKH